MIISKILNPQLLSLLANSGHTDFVTVCDRGFPVPRNQPTVDLSLVDNIPTVMDVLRALQDTFVVDRFLVAFEMQEFSLARLREMQMLFPDTQIDFVSHVDLKQLAEQGKGVIRTADTCPYANVVVVSG